MILELKFVRPGNLHAGLESIATDLVLLCSPRQPAAIVLCKCKRRPCFCCGRPHCSLLHSGSLEPSHATLMTAWHYVCPEQALAVTMRARMVDSSSAEQVWRCCRRCRRTTGFGSSCTTAARPGACCRVYCCRPPAQSECSSAQRIIRKPKLRVAADQHECMVG